MPATVSHHVSELVSDYIATHRAFLDGLVKIEHSDAQVTCVHPDGHLHDLYIWGVGFGSDATQVFLSIEDGKGTVLGLTVTTFQPQSGIFLTTQWNWTPIKVPSFAGLPTPIMRARANNGAEATTGLALDVVYTT